MLLWLSEAVTDAITHSDSDRAPACMVTVRMVRIGTGRNKSWSWAIRFACHCSGGRYSAGSAWVTVTTPG